MTATTCPAPGHGGQPCGREIYAAGYCGAHYRQRLRGGPLRPISRDPEVRRAIVKLAVSPRAARRVAADKDGARGALEEWATKK